jgi:carbon-monoxide dehydrogenase medium subunit
VEQALAGGASAADAAAQSGSDIDPTGDVRATAEYKRHLAEVLTTRTLQKATMAA